jgi:hypothetical protein
MDRNFYQFFYAGETSALAPRDLFSAQSSGMAEPYRLRGQFYAF